MRSADFNTPTRRWFMRRNWVMETLVVLGIVAFGLFVLSLEGHLTLLPATGAGVELPTALAR